MARMRANIKWVSSFFEDAHYFSIKKYSFLKVKNKAVYNALN